MVVYEHFNSGSKPVQKYINFNPDNIKLNQQVKSHLEA